MGKCNLQFVVLLCNFKVVKCPIKLGSQRQVFNIYCKWIKISFKKVSSTIACHVFDVFMGIH